MYYRLNVVPIVIPTLRKRKEDIPTLVEHFLLKSSSISKNTPKHINNDVMLRLINYEWPGNIRELENMIERCVVVTVGNIITLEDLPDNMVKCDVENEACLTKANTLDETVDNAEKSAIIKSPTRM